MMDPHPGLGQGVPLQGFQRVLVTLGSASPGSGAFLTLIWDKDSKGTRARGHRGLKREAGSDQASLVAWPPL